MAAGLVLGETTGFSLVGFSTTCSRTNDVDMEGGAGPPCLSIRPVDGGVGGGGLGLQGEGLSHPSLLSPWKVLI